MIMLNQAKETSLIALVNDDDDTAFAELYDYYFPRVYNYVHYRVDDYYDAEDLTSQIFEKLFSGIKYYQAGKAPFSAWLFSIARNTITDYYRSRKRVQFTSLESVIELIDFEPGPDDNVFSNEMKQHLRQALTSLDQRERDIIALKFWSGASNRDIAKLVGISESNTGVILFRAMRRLRIILESQGMSINV